MQGNAVSILQLGSTYLLEVTIDQEADLRNVRFEHLTCLDLELRNVNKINIMSSIKTQQVYLARPRYEGTYTVGPAFCALSAGTIVRSNSLTIQIIKQSQHAKLPIFLTLEPSSDTLLLGVPTHLILTLYTRSSLHLVGLEKPSLDPAIATIGDCLQGEQGTEHKNGIAYQFQQWRIEIIPHKEGTLTIEPFNVRIRKTQGNTVGGSLFHAMVYGLQEERIASNELTLSVRPLPPYNGIVHGIGHVRSVTATLDQTAVLQGEGSVLTLSVEGDNNVARFIQPQLELPEGLKYYSSTERYLPHADGVHGTKNFEYVLQGIKQGTYTIPAQTIVYFDLGSHHYKEMASTPLTLNVRALNGAPPSLHAQAGSSTKNEFEKFTVSCATLLPIIPLGIFWKLLTLLGSVLVGMFVWNYWFYRIQTEKMRSIRKARAQLRSVKHARGIYPLIINLFSELLHLSPGEVTQEKIVQWFDRRGASESLKEGWKRYIDQIGTVVFGESSQMVSNEQELVQAMRLWLEKIQELCNE